MFSSLQNFVRRHKKKFLLAGVVVGGTVILSRYIEQKLQEWREREMQEFLESTRRQQHFESTERTCNLTILSIVPSFKTTIVKVLDSDQLTSQLKQRTANRLELWEKLKVVAFTRLAGLVYGGTLLVILLRIQLNIVGGYIYRDSIQEGIAQVHASGRQAVDSSLQEKYLALCHHYLEEGLPALCGYIENKVQSVVQGISLKQKLSLMDVERLFESVQMAIREDTVGKAPLRDPNWYIFPLQRSQQKMDDGHLDESMFDKMVLETMDVLESEDTLRLLETCASQGFSLLMDRLAEYFSDNTFGEVVNMKYSSPTQNIVEVANTGSATVGESADAVVRADLVTIQSDGKPTSQSWLNHAKWVNCVQKQTEDYCMSNDMASSVFNNSHFINPNHVSVPLAKLIPVINGLIYWGEGSSSASMTTESPDPWIQHLILMDTVKTLGANVYESFCQEQPKIG